MLYLALGLLLPTHALPTVGIEFTASTDSISAPTAPCRAEEILWSDGDRLDIADFRGPDGAEGLSAEASTGIGSKSAAEADGRHFRITITSFFDPCQSWMRAKERNAYTLAHEQVHFDITELHARQLARRYASDVKNAKDFMRVHKRFYEDTWKASRAMQKRYDSEVYDNPEAQARWQLDIARRIDASAADAGKVVVLPIQ